jgi:hypothetical protein
MNVVAPVLLMLGLSCSANADEAQAEACVRTKVWEGYSDGWAIRTMTSTSLELGATRNYLVTFYPGKEYQIQTCGDSAVKELDVVMYDLQGKAVKRDDSTGREPSLSHTTQSVETYYVVVHARELAPGQSKGGVALAVTYR